MLLLSLGSTESNNTTPLNWGKTSFYLEIPGTIFVEGGAGGRIEPAGLGVSTFSVVNEHRG